MRYQKISLLVILFSLFLTGCTQVSHNNLDESQTTEKQAEISQEDISALSTVVTDSYAETESSTDIELETDIENVIQEETEASAAEYETIDVYQGRWESLECRWYGDETEFAGNKYTYYSIISADDAAALPRTVELSDGRIMEFFYDEWYRLAARKIDGEPVAEYEWTYDYATGENYLELEESYGHYVAYYYDYFVTDALMGKGKRQLRRVEYYADASHYSKSYGVVYDENDECIIGLGDLYKVEYEDNKPVIYKADNNGDNSWSNISAEEYLGSLFINGAVYIPELEMYYYPDRGFIDAKTKQVFNPASFNYAGMQDTEEIKNIDGCEIGCGSIQGSPGCERPFYVKKDGEIIAEYYWIDYIRANETALDRAVINGIETRYVYKVINTTVSDVIELHGFNYNGELYTYDFESEEDEAIDIYKADEYIATYDRMGNYISGTEFPKEVLPMGYLWGDTGMRIYGTDIYYGKAQQVEENIPECFADIAQQVLWGDEVKQWTEQQKEAATGLYTDFEICTVVINGFYHRALYSDKGVGIIDNHSAGTYSVYYNGCSLSVLAESALGSDNQVLIDFADFDGDGVEELFIHDAWSDYYYQHIVRLEPLELVESTFDESVISDIIKAGGVEGVEAVSENEVVAQFYIDFTKGAGVKGDVRFNVKDMSTVAENYELIFTDMYTIAANMPDWADGELELFIKARVVKKDDSQSVNAYEYGKDILIYVGLEYDKAEDRYVLTDDITVEWQTAERGQQVVEP